MPHPTTTERDALSVEEVAARLGISRKTAYKLAGSNRLPAPTLRVGRRLLVGRAALDRALAGEAGPDAQSNGDGDAVA